MADSVSLTEGELGARLRSDAKGVPKALMRAMFSAAHRGRSFIVGESPVDRGILRNAWKVIRLSDGVELTNDQPYAGIVERGSRPFKVSKEGLKSLEGWVFRKILDGSIALKNAGKASRKKYLPIGVAKLRAEQHKQLVKANLEDEARSIAYAIAKSFERFGMKGKRFVFKNLPKLAELMDLEVKRSLSNFFSRPIHRSKKGSSK